MEFRKYEEVCVFVSVLLYDSTVNAEYDPDSEHVLYGCTDPGTSVGLSAGKYLEAWK